MRVLMHCTLSWHAFLQILQKIPVMALFWQKNISEILRFPSYFPNLRTEPKYLFVLFFIYVWGSIGQRDILVPSAGVETVTKHVQHSAKFLFCGKG